MSFHVKHFIKRFSYQEANFKIKKCWGNVLEIRNIQKEDEIFKLDVNYRIFLAPFVY